MNLRNLFFVFCGFVIVAYFTLFAEAPSKPVKTKVMIDRSKVANSKSPICLQMYDAIIKYADQYDIPRKYAFGIAYSETRYQGPFHWKYNHRQLSSAGAIGPMQIMPSTGQSHWKGTGEYTKERLMYDVDFNVHTSMKVLRKLHNIYGDWKMVFGCYNTGRPCVNDYALRVYNHKINWRM